MNTTLSILHFISGWIVLAEALNKLERSDLFSGQAGWRPRVRGFGWLLMPWAWQQAHIVSVVKALAWFLLAIGAAGALATPLMHLDRPTFQDVAVIGGFALLIVRTRLKEAQWN